MLQLSFPPERLADADMSLQLRGAVLTRLNRARQPSLVTASDRLQMPVSEQQEIDLM